MKSLLASASLAIFVMSYLPAASADMLVCDLHFSNGQSLKSVPVATTLPQMEKGLSQRKDIGPGMLFAWPQAEPRTFWMRDTWVPLSIGFFDEAGKLFKIEDMQPNSDTHHESGLPARYALELSAGQYPIVGLRPGDSLSVGECKK